MLYNQQTEQKKHKATPAPENIATRLKGPGSNKKNNTFGPLGTTFGTWAFSTGSMCPSLKTSHWNSVGTHGDVNMLHVEGTF